MSKKMNTLDKIIFEYDLSKRFMQIILFFGVIALSAIGFSTFNKAQDEPYQNRAKFTERTEVLSADYEKIYGYARMDSATPPLMGIKVKYTYQVNNQKIKGKQTFYKKGFKEIMNGINQKPEILEVRYKSNNPKESIIMIKEFVLK